MEKQHPINEMMSTTMEKIRSMMDANTIIGDPIQTGEVTLIPSPGCPLDLPAAGATL